MSGLPWISLDRNFPDSRKAIALGIATGNDMAWAYVVRLWTWCAKNAADGRLEGPGAADIAELAAGWKGPKGTLVEAMTLPHIRLLDLTSSGFEVHDWEEHAGAHIIKLAKDKKRKATARAEDRAQRVRGQSTDSPAMSTYKREREIEREEATTLALSPTVSALSTVAVSVPCVGPGPKDYGVTDAQIDKWRASFPGVDVVAEVRKAAAWADANPSKRKTHAGVPRFIVAWLGRAQDRGSAPAARPTRGMASPSTDWTSDAATKF